MEAHCLYTYEDIIMKPPNTEREGSTERGNGYIIEGLNLFKVHSTHV
jgi:hypothetical protein